MKKNNKTNYIILIAIILITLLVTLYSLAWYKNSIDSKINTPIITETIQEVQYNNLDEILSERDFLIMYTCTTTDKECRKFEKDFDDYIKDENLNTDVVYFNLGYDEDENSNLEKVYEKYKHPDLIKKLYDYPTLFIFSNGKIVDVLSQIGDKPVTIDKVKEFLRDYEI
jgi:hypothetical protein